MRSLSVHVVGLSPNLGLFLHLQLDAIQCFVLHIQLTQLGQHDVFLLVKSEELSFAPFHFE